MEPATDKQIWKMQQLCIAIPEGCTKQQAIELIGQKTGTPPINTLPKFTAKKKTSDNSSYYLAYAKDICIALIEAGHYDKETGVTLDDIMLMCIKVVKNAKEAFENE